jgi:hypothetical protein
LPTRAPPISPRNPTGSRVFPPSVTVQVPEITLLRGRERNFVVIG